jgi:exodeoxyribonuclease VII small subunit
MDNNLTYEMAYKELEEIKDAIAGESIAVDVLADKVKRASQLIAFCQEKLRATETEVNAIIAQMEPGKQA